jgi:hypothetical protein
VSGAGPHSGSITIYSPYGGTVSITGTDNGNVTTYGNFVGSLTVTGDMNGAITLNNNGSLNGPVSITGGLNGPVSIGGGNLAANLTAQSFSGDLTVGGNVTACAHALGDVTHPINISGNIAGSGRVQIGGGLSSILYVHGNIDKNGGQPAIDVAGALTSQVRVNGYLADDLSYSPEIYVGTMGATGAVTIDWDANHRGYRDWMSGAAIQVGSSTYYGNFDSAHLYETSCIIGDTDNSGALDTFDIDSFAKAIQGDGSAYNSTYCGLSESRVFHADCDCDTYANAFDIDPFVMKLINPAQWAQTYPDCAAEECGPYLDGGGLSQPPEDSLDYTPENVAALFQQTLSDEGLSAVVSVIEQAIEGYGDTPRGEFWTEVLALLE